MNGITRKVLSDFLYRKRGLQQLRGKHAQNCTRDWKSLALGEVAGR
jgi:hypothetical protein